MAEEKKITLELTPTELFQLHLCVVARSANATVKWANACSEQEQEHLQKTIAFLSTITAKLLKKLEELQNDGGKN